MLMTGAALVGVAAGFALIAFCLEGAGRQAVFMAAAVLGGPGLLLGVIGWIAKDAQVPPPPVIR